MRAKRKLKYRKIYIENNLTLVRKDSSKSEAVRNDRKKESKVWIPNIHNE